MSDAAAGDRRPASDDEGSSGAIYPRQAGGRKPGDVQLARGFALPRHLWRWRLPAGLTESELLWAYRRPGASLAESPTDPELLSPSASGRRADD